MSQCDRIHFQVVNVEAVKFYIIGIFIIGDKWSEKNKWMVQKCKNSGEGEEGWGWGAGGAQCY